MVNASRKAGLGRTLQKVQKFANQRRNPRKTDRHTTETNPNQDNAKLDLRSVTAQTNLDEFFEEAELAGRQFVTERRNLALISENEPNVQLYNQSERIVEPMLKLEDIDIESSLCVPRRPKWDSNTTPEVLAERERLTFLTWRKKLAKLQDNENVILTPFEKNIEVWRQLWRVIERSDIIVQILDCRNPLLYLCDDLIKYVNEEFAGKKMNLILLNKADYLTKEQREMWLAYFKVRGIKVIFFSALLEGKNMSKRDAEEEAETSGAGNSNDDDSSDESVSSEKDDKQSDRENDGELDTEFANNLQSKLDLEGDDQDDETRIFDKFELLDTWHDLLVKLKADNSVSNQDLSKLPGDEKLADGGSVKFADDISETSTHNRPLTVGLVGYPNVGKSSTINALLSAKRVAVSATPGKTKHFQTFFIDKDMMLCDCPGLVFPNFVSSKSEMIINGILPIDQMKDYVGPVRIIVERVPRGFFEEIYGLAFDQDAKQNIIADDLLNAFGFMRGYMTARGLPDISRAARKICKDYINGKILYCEPPPNVDKKLYHSHSKLADAMKRIEEQSNDPKSALRITERQSRLMRQAKGTDVSSKEFDAKYFQNNAGGAHIKGLPGIGNMTQPIGQHYEIKVHKRERRHKKREKLRVVYRDLDI